MSGIIDLGHTYDEYLVLLVKLGMTGNTYLWHVLVIIYERPTTDHICRTHQVVEASTPRLMFEGGMREATREALAFL
jgi:hypothetical protein